MSAPSWPASLWTDAHARNAEAEGWGVFSRSEGPEYEIQRIDDLEEFASDRDAAAHVEALARAYGMPHHEVALQIHEHYGAWYEAKEEARRRLGDPLWRALMAERTARPLSEAEMLENTVPAREPPAQGLGA